VPEEFPVLLEALRVVKKHESEMKKGGSRGGLGREKRLRVWDKLMYALGGEDFLKDLVLSIETSKSNLQLLLDSLKFRILKTLSTKYVTLLPLLSILQKFDVSRY
jgi:hypothetical protein